MLTPEPVIIKGQDPELSLHNAIVAEVRRLLTQAGVKFLLLEEFGLDIAVFIQRDSRNYARFIEVKAFVGSRGGGVGFGNGTGKGSQVDLLLHSPQELQIVDSSIRWILGMGAIPAGSPRYAMFTNTQAKKASMGGVARGKQNNLRVSDFQKQLITWDDLSKILYRFLL